MEITLEVVAIILSVVSLILTGVGFFASLKFYRDGTELQKNANTALIKLSEKTETIRDQVIGINEKVLDAAIGSDQLIDQNFDSLNEELQNSKESVLNEINKSGKNNIEVVKKEVDDQIDRLQKKIDSVRGVTKSVLDANIDEYELYILEYIANNPMSRTNEITDIFEDQYEDIYPMQSYTSAISLKDKGFIKELNDEKGKKFKVTPKGDELLRSKRKSA